MESTTPYVSILDRYLNFVKIDLFLGQKGFSNISLSHLLVQIVKGEFEFDFKPSNSHQPIDVVRGT